MSTVLYCSKQATAMAEFAADRAKSKLDDVIDAEESRNEMIAARTQELVIKRVAEMAPIDILAGLQGILEVGAERMRPHILANRAEYVGAIVIALVNLYIEQDSEVMANDWMDRIDAEVSSWEH
jgi:hypothetical protein